jgi:hypothetical protein
VAGPEENPPEAKHSNIGVVMGLHLGAEAAAGSLPSNVGSLSASEASSAGVAFGLDAAFRFGRHFLAGLTLDHAALNNGTADSVAVGTTYSTSTTYLGVVLAFIGNPDRVAFYGEIGAGERWINVHHEVSGGNSGSDGYASNQFDLGLGVWIPIGHRVRLLPKGTLTMGSVGDPAHTDTTFATFAMFALQGQYNLDF